MIVLRSEEFGNPDDKGATYVARFMAFNRKTRKMLKESGAGFLTGTGGADLRESHPGQSSRKDLLG